MRCGKVALSIDAMAVSATLLSPLVQSSPLAMGHCRGVIEHAGLLLPALDFQALLGLGPAPPSDLTQAFVMNTPDGAIAFLITEVMDVARCREADFLAVPRFALPHPTLFSGTLPREALSDEVVHRSRASITQFLRVDGRALQQDEEVRNLASTVHHRGARERRPPNDTHGVEASASGVQSGRSVLTFMLGGETATPLDQIQEILPYTRDISIFDTRGSLLGVLINRGRSIPVMCLSGLVGLPAPDVSPAVSVLVVESQGTLIGFAVPMLKSIERTHWEPSLTGGACADTGDVAEALRSKTLVQVGEEPSCRMLPLIDLAAVSRALRMQGADCPCV
jgi:purine-binding chemotaxis protein CheW